MAADDDASPSIKLLVCVSYELSYLSAVDQEHTGHGQFHQHQDEQEDEKLESGEKIRFKHSKRAGLLTVKLQHAHM